ncbi:Abi-like protein [Corynebacterium lowii]|uniref:Abi-like protein n=1 Tax=Corynebacterium lowii TaxID=1544413 RepID=A0A0Q1E0H3_9CORY|nr:Abi-like protein [Corynebacterium lowii]MDP9850603.1 hypothetical protein [Corynebacterium lowii]
MKQGARRKVIAALHRSRMGPYLEESGGNEKNALALYGWHAELSAAVQQVLGITEVILRNAMDKQLQEWNRREGGGRSWLLEEPVAPLRGLVGRKRREAYRRACKEAELREENHPRYGDSVSHDDVLSQVMFGMWKDLLPNYGVNASFDNRGNSNRRRLWTEALCSAFPYSDDPHGERTYWRVAKVHGLRNRVSHMDSLLNVDVRDEVGEAFSLVRSIDPDVANWLTGVSRVAQVSKGKPR